MSKSAATHSGAPVPHKSDESNSTEHDASVSLSGTDEINDNQSVFDNQSVSLSDNLDNLSMASGSKSRLDKRTLMRLNKLKEENLLLRESLERARMTDVTMLMTKLRASNADLVRVRQNNSELKDRCQILEGRLFNALAAQSMAVGAGVGVGGASSRIAALLAAKAESAGTGARGMGGGIAEGDSAEAPEGSETGETETDSRSNRVPGLRSLQSRNKHLLRLAQSYEKKIALLQAELDAQSKAVLIGTDTRAHSVTVHSPGKENRDQQSSKGDIPSSQPTPVESVEIIMGADPITRLTSEDSQLTHFFSDSRGPTSSSRIGPQILPNPNPNPILSSSLSPSADADVDADTEDVNLQSILAALGEVENAVLSARQGEVAQRSVQFSATLSQYLSKAEAQNMVVSAREGDRRMIQELSSEVKRLVALLPRGLVDPEEGEAEAEVAGERVLGVGLRGIGKGAGWLIGGEAETEGVEAEAKIGAGAEEEEESGEEEEGESEEEVSSQPPIGAHMLKSPTINAYSSGAVVMSFCFGLIAMMICFAISALLLPVPIPIMPQK